MARDQDNADERQIRINTMIEQFRAAQQRRVVRRGITQWKRAEAMQLAHTFGSRLPPEKIH